MTGERELDSQIAAWMGDDFGEKPTHQWASTWDVDDNPSKDFYCRRCWDFADEQLPGPCVTVAAPYTTNIAAAWMILERFAFWNLQRVPGAPYGNSATVRVGGVTDMEHEGEASAETMPLAICRAALVAVSASAEMNPWSGRGDES
jgi:hypothetical protein